VYLARAVLWFVCWRSLDVTVGGNANCASVDVVSVIWMWFRVKGVEEHRKHGAAVMAIDPSVVYSSLLTVFVTAETDSCWVQAKARAVAVMGVPSTAEEVLKRMKGQIS
jgi:hypothetical protein